MDTVFYISCRISGPYLIRRYIFGNNTACTYDCALSYSHRITNCYINTDKDIIFNVNFPDSEFSAFCRRVKIVGQYFRPSRNSYIIAYINIIWRYCVNKNTAIY